MVLQGVIVFVFYVIKGLCNWMLLLVFERKPQVCFCLYCGFLRKCMTGRLLKGERKVEINCWYTHTYTNKINVLFCWRRSNLTRLYIKNVLWAVVLNMRWPMHEYFFYACLYICKLFDGSLSITDSKENA